MPSSEVIVNIDPEEIRRRIINRALLLKLGQQTLLIIKERTLKGIFLPGSSPGSEKYSTKPAPMPLGAFKARVGKTRAREIWKDIQGKDFIYTNNKMTWILLQGGYKRLRELAGREADRVTLNWTGAMMRAFKVTTVNEAEGSVTLSFTDNRAAELAGFHHDGAGKNRIKRIFMGLTEQEISTVIAKVNFKN